MDERNPQNSERVSSDNIQIVSIDRKALDSAHGLIPMAITNNGNTISYG